MSETLKPCPFCGGAGHVSHSFGKWYAACEASWLRGDGCAVGPFTHFESREAAVAAWNTRAEDPALAALRKELADTKRERLLAEDEVASAATRLEEEQCRCDDALAALRKELSDTKALLERKNDACRSHLIDLDDAQTERAAVEANLAELRKALETSESQGKSVEGYLRAAEAENDAMRKELREL